ncbi:MAG TPA: hypothetical protein VIR33_15970, partial [Thermopolyspora sp.]
MIADAAPKDEALVRGLGADVVLPRADGARRRSDTFPLPPRPEALQEATSGRWAHGPERRPNCRSGALPSRIVRPAKLDRLTVQQAADRYVELVRARTITGGLSPATAEIYARDIATLVRLAGPDRILDDLTGQDVDAVLLAFARKPDGRRTEPGPGRQSAWSQARFRRSVSALFKHAVLAGWVQLDPMPAATVTAKERGGLRAERRALT